MPTRTPTPSTTTARASPRHAGADTLKVLLVVGVIVGHISIAWSGLEGWVFDEPPVREPLLTVVKLVAVVGTLFAMALFFMIAGLFTPGSLERKGLRRFLRERTVRLAAPVVFYCVVFAPPVEYVDSDNVGWTGGFARFALHIWRHPAPGPTWFLAVLLLMSAAYAIGRTIFPRTVAGPRPIRARDLVLAAVFISVCAYVIRLAVPFGEEYQHLALGQAGSWTAGFALGIVAAERGWFDQLTVATSRRLFRVAWSSAAAVLLIVMVTAVFKDGDVDVLFGGGTWRSMVLPLVEGPLVVSMSLWMFDAFRRHVTAQGRLMQQLSRAAFAAFIVHQIIGVGAVLATRQVAWPAEIEYPLAAALAVAGSFGIAALVVRIPGVSRFV